MIDGAAASITVADYLASVASTRAPLINIDISAIANGYVPVSEDLAPFTREYYPYVDVSDVYASHAIQQVQHTRGAITVSVADDAVIDLVLPQREGLMIVTPISSTTSTKPGSTLLVSYNSRAAVGAAEKANVSAYGDVAVFDTNLTGTVGVNGNYTVSIKVGGAYQIENRLGFASNFRVMFIN